MASKCPRSSDEIFQWLQNQAKLWFMKSMAKSSSSKHWLHAVDSRYDTANYNAGTCKYRLQVKGGGY